MIMLQEDTRRSFGSVGDLGWVLGNCRNGYIIVSSCHMGPVCDWEKLVCMVYLCFSRVPLVHSLEALKHTILKKTESFYMQSRKVTRDAEASLGKSFTRKWILRCFLLICPLFPSLPHVSSMRAELCDHIICHPILGVKRGTIDNYARAAGRNRGGGVHLAELPVFCEDCTDATSPLSATFIMLCALIALCRYPWHSVPSWSLPLNCEPFEGKSSILIISA